MEDFKHLVIIMFMINAFVIFFNLSFQPHRNLQTCCFQMQNRYHDQHGLLSGALSSDRSSG